MTKFKNILLVLHGKHNEGDAIKRAYTLAKTNKAKLTILAVLEEIPKTMKDYLDVISPEELEKIIIDERISELKKLINPIEKKTGVKSAVKTLIGKPHIEITKEVLRNKNDLVMKTPEGRGGRKETLFGHIDINILRKCPCPVWMIKPSKSQKYSRVLAAVDPDPYDETRNKLNYKIMELALSVSKLEKSELHIVHAWRLYGENALMGPRFRKSKAEMNKLIQNARNTHKKWVEDLLKESGINKIKHTLHLIKGYPDVSIASVARKEKIDLIVMGTVCRTGLPGFLIGNTAENILYKVNCSVLSIKPYGFISPVKI